MGLLANSGVGISQQSLVHLFVDLVDTQRSAPTKDSGGGAVSTWATNLSGVAGRFNSFMGSEVVGRDRINVSKKSCFYTLSGQDIEVADRIVFNSRTFDIQSKIDFDELVIYARFELAEVLPSAVG